MTPVSVCRSFSVFLSPFQGPGFSARTPQTTCLGAQWGAAENTALWRGTGESALHKLILKPEGTAVWSCTELISGNAFSIPDGPPQRPPPHRRPLAHEWASFISKANSMASEVGTEQKRILTWFLLQGFSAPVRVM